MSPKSRRFFHVCASVSKFFQLTTHKPFVLVVLILLATVAVTAQVPSSVTGRNLAGAAEEPQRIQISGTLPMGTVQQAYNAVLSASGGTPPYRFLVVAGQLPRGLALNSKTGSIAGVPVNAGDFTFLVMAWDIEGNPGSKVFFLAIQPPSQIDITVTPASISVASAHSQQFTALVRGTSQTGVAWSASAGKVSASGLFVAPTVSTTTTATVTAASVANPLKKASATVTVTAPGLPSPTITTSSLPGATDGVAYAATVSATGGTLPYQWSIASGALPSGIQLNGTTGALSGTTKVQGQFAFTAKVTDANQKIATQNLTLSVAGSVTGHCGPPNYNCTTRSTTTSVALTAPFSSSDPVNATKHDNTLNPSSDCITRITDYTTFGGQSSGSTSSGGDNDVMSSVNTTYVGVGTSGGGIYLLKLDTSGSCAQVVSPAPGQAATLHAPHPFGFSRKNDNVFYHTNTRSQSHYSDLWKATIRSDFSGYDEVLLFDFKNCPGTPANGSGIGRSGSILSIGLNDAYFGMNISWTGGQGTATTAYVYRASDGACSAINLATGNWYNWCVGACSNQPPSGNEAICRTAGIHDQQLSLDGKFQWISQGCASNGFGVWQVGTGNVENCQRLTTGDNCSGHDSVGVTHMVVHTTPYNIRANSNVHTYTNFYTQLAVFNETHGFWPHPTGDDSYPWISAGGGKLPGCQNGGGGDFTRPPTGCAEIFASYPNMPLGTPGPRFAHTYLTGQNNTQGAPYNVNFACRYGIGYASQDGKWFFWDTMMLNNLGLDNGGNHMCSLFAVKLE